jgi:hypothetical protein
VQNYGVGQWQYRRPLWAGHGLARNVPAKVFEELAGVIGTPDEKSI